VLTATTTGEANAFTVTNGLTGGTGIAFADTDGDGTSGDDAADNAVQASDASLLVNNIPIISATNTIDAAVPGATITLFRQDPATPVVIDVAADPSQLKTKVTDFITAYNELVKFATDQAAAAGKGDQSSIGRDPLLRQLRNQLRSALSGEYGAGGPLTALAQAGIEFTQTGTLALNEATFDAAAKSAASGIPALFAGTTDTPGVFGTLGTLLGSYTQGDGLLPGARRQLTEQASRLTDQIATLQDRLALRRAALQREFIAADQAMSLLKSQSGSLAQFGTQL
jgi:flagellar hook-associated protein 2